MPSQHAPSTPARLTATATRKLPRAVLILAGITYILAGLFFRDPWKTDDVVGLATMLSAVNSADITAWLLPRIGSLTYTHDGPLITWAGALSIHVFAPFLELFTTPLDAAIIASRLPNLLWFALLGSSVWYGTYLLGRRPEPQPLALPFGGEPSVHDYGRMIADAALLLILATIGIIWLLHETSAVPAQLAFQALSFYAVARMLDRPVSGSITLGISLAAVFLTRGWLGVLPVLLAVLLCFRRQSPLYRHKKWLALTLPITGIIALLWWLPANWHGHYWIKQWWHWHTSQLGWPNLGHLTRVARDLPWFLWPVWPFTLFALWRWRGWYAAPHIWVPLMFAALPAAFILFVESASEPEFSLLAVPCAVLAAFALPTLRRGLVNALDWFAVMCFSLAIATVWLGWAAQQSGWPPKIAHNIARQTTGYDITFSWAALIIAAAGTLLWLIMVRWRVMTHPRALWRGTVLSASGLLVTWLLLVTLWMPALDYARSYREVSGELAAVLDRHVQPGDCLRALNVGAGQRASFAVFNDLDLTFNTRCRFILQQANQSDVADQTVYTPDNAYVIWEGKRRADRHEMFRLLVRLPAD